MKLEKLVGERFKERPADCVIDSHAIMVKGGYIKYMANGIYSSYLPLRRIVRKIEQILREEMDKIDGQEVQFPVVMPASLWDESGRYDSIGDELLRFTDRNNAKMVLGMTHEEAAVHLVREYAQSYTKYPFMIYQIQTKFRDETRPRYGLIRVREFIMKDAYSFDIDEAGLQESYMKMFQAYKNIMDRCNLNYKIVKADTGAMGGSLSEEFQAITEIGEDVVVTCEGCDFSSNLEITEVIDTGRPSDEEALDMEIVETPDAKTIEDVAAFFQKSVNDFVKTLIYSVDGKTMAFLLKGDRELNETKVLKLLQANEMELASFDEVERVTHARVGFAGPVGLECPIIMDREVANMKNFIVGANKTDHHIKNVNLKDFTVETVADIAQVHEGDICPKCGKPLKFCKGIEVGNTFKLGTKYAKALGLEYQDVNNKLHPVEMGCYGFGLERCMAAIVEQHNDASGIIWPTSVAPFEVAVVVVSSKDDEQMRIGNELYEALKKEGIDVLLDDRKERPGVKFKDMELIGIPYRITVGRGIKDGNVEFRARTADESSDVSLHEIVDMVKKELQK